MDLHQTAVDLWKLRNVSVSHELEVVVVEHLAIPARDGARFVHSSLGQKYRKLATGATRHDDQAVAVCLKDLPVHPGLVVEPLQVRGGDQLDEVPVAGVALGEDGHVVWAAFVGVALVPAARCDVHLASDDRANALGLGVLVEVDRSVHAAVVGDGEAVHSEVFGALYQGFDAAEAVQHGVFGVGVKVGEQRVPLSTGVSWLGAIISPERGKIRAEFWV